MSVTLRQLRAFTLVAQLGNFTRAAEAMHVTQSALSLLMRELEAELKTRLVDRNTRSVSLTATGTEFYASTQRILADLEQAIANVSKLEAKKTGRVVIAAPILLSSTLVPRMLAGFKKLYPGVDLVLNDALSSDVMVQVRTGAADLAIGTFAKTDEDLDKELLFKEALVAVFPRSHPFARVRHLTWHDLGTTRVGALRKSMRELVEAGFAASGLSLQPAFESNYVGSLIGMVDAGFGVAIVPDHVTVLANKKNMTWKRIENPIIERRVFMVQRAGLTLSPAARAFAEFLKQEVSRRQGGRKTD